MSNIVNICERLTKVTKVCEASPSNIFAKVRYARLLRELQAEEGRMLWPLLGEEQADRLIVTTHNEKTGTVRVTVEVRAEVAEALVGANDIDGRLAACGFERIKVGEALDGLRFIHFITAA